MNDHRLVPKILSRTRGLLAALPRAPDKGAGRMVGSFKSLVTVGPVPWSVVPRGLRHISAEPAVSAGSVNVKSLIGAAVRMTDAPRPCLVLTTSDLHVDGRMSVFGYSDRARQIAVVSLHGLTGGVLLSSLVKRVQNEIAHELGHLNGLGHCAGACVMKPVHAAAELDSRPIRPCGYCPRRGFLQMLRKVLACALVAASGIAGNEMLSRAFPPVGTPFTCWAVDGCGRQSFGADGPHDEVSIYFERQKLLTLLDKGGRHSLRERSLPAVEVLNGMARSTQPIHVTVLRRQQGRYAIGIPGRQPFLEVLPGDLRAGEDAPTVASQWAIALNHSLDHYVHGH